MQILYSKGSGTDINVERIENLAVKKCGWVRGEDRDDLSVCLERLLTRNGSMLMKLTCSELKDSKKLMMNGARY